MESLETLFSTENEIVEKLKGYAYKPDYKKLFFEHLGPELNKIYMNKKKIFTQNFLEAAQYEYGFFDKNIYLQKAFNLYKKYADLNDYFCMYKMHVIYLCEYKKFNVHFNRVLEKIYLLKCFAYLPNYIDDWNVKLFETIDVILEIAQQLDLEDGNLEKHLKFFDLLSEQKEKYNLSENDINLMADNGKLYPGFTQEFAFAMAKLCGKADIVVPNMTEASFMLGVPYRAGGTYDEAYLKKIIKDIAALGAKKVVLKGVEFQEDQPSFKNVAGKIGIVAYDAEKDVFTSYFHDKIPQNFHGTGDIFASVFTGAVLRGLTLEESYSLAADFVVEAIKETMSHENHNWYGVDFEAVFPYLIKRLEK